MKSSFQRSSVDSSLVLFVWTHEKVRLVPLLIWHENKESICIKGHLTWLHKLLRLLQGSNQFYVAVLFSVCMPICSPCQSRGARWLLGRFSGTAYLGSFFFSSLALPIKWELVKPKILVSSAPVPRCYSRTTSLPKKPSQSRLFFFFLKGNRADSV